MKGHMALCSAKGKWQSKEITARQRMGIEWLDIVKW